MDVGSIHPPTLASQEQPDTQRVNARWVTSSRAFYTLLEKRISVTTSTLLHKCITNLLHNKSAAALSAIYTLPLITS
jgi:hypothetical protein